MSSSATKVQRPRLVAHWKIRSQRSECYKSQVVSLKRHQRRKTLTACLAWMLAVPSFRMVLKTGFSVLKTSSLSIPEPSWMHRRHAREAAALCSTPLPESHHKQAENFTSVIPTRIFKAQILNRKPFFKQRSMLSVMVILLSVINSYRILVAMAVFSPSRAPCLVLALGRECNYTVQTAAVGFAKTQRTETLQHHPLCCAVLSKFRLKTNLLSTVLSMYTFSLYWKSS